MTYTATHQQGVIKYLLASFFGVSLVTPVNWNSRYKTLFWLLQLCCDAGFCAGTWATRSESLTFLVFSWKCSPRGKCECFRFWWLWSMKHRFSGMPSCSVWMLTYNWMLRHWTRTSSQNVSRVKRLSSMPERESKFDSFMLSHQFLLRNETKNLSVLIITLTETLFSLLLTSSVWFAGESH